jgi:hypothetical protein
LRKGVSLEKILTQLKEKFGLGAIVLRDERDRILAASPADSTPKVPQTQLNFITLFPSEETKHRLGTKGFRLPEGGGRLSFKTDRASIFIDLWEGDPQGLDLDKSRTLAIAALILALEMSSRKENRVP